MQENYFFQGGLQLPSGHPENRRLCNRAPEFGDFDLTPAVRGH